jgi:hypothetical protein
MSRTIKDKPSSLLYNTEERNKPKLKKHKDTEYHWMTTPMWWVRLIMNRPQRAQSHILEKLAVGLKDLEDFDFRDTRKKPFVYYS